MRDLSIDPRERLAFYPAMAPFVLSFADLNKLVLRRDAAMDVFQELVNLHTHEDENHWPFYLMDLCTLGFDVKAHGADWMRFLWSDELVKGRLLMYRLIALCEQTTSAERLTLVECIEETSNVLFFEMLPSVEELEKQLHAPLHYCGGFHFGCEKSYLTGAARKDIATLAISGETRERCQRIIREVFSLFEAWTHELLRFAEQHPAHDGLSLGPRERRRRELVAEHTSATGS
jgi:hypothetical protein